MANLRAIRNIMYPLSKNEMLELVPQHIREIGMKDTPRIMIFSAISAMDRNLESARKISMIPSDEYLKNRKDGESRVQTQYRIKGIQRQISAVRFRMDIHDYTGVLEKAALRLKLHDLYDTARVIDPEGTKKFERMIDKQMKKGERRNGNYRR